MSVRRVVRTLLLSIAPLSPMWWGFATSRSSGTALTVTVAFWVLTVILSLLELLDIWGGPFNAFAGGRPKFWLTVYLGANGIGLLFVSAASATEWWESLWLSLGSALILGSLIDLIVEVRLADHRSGTTTN